MKAAILRLHLKVGGVEVNMAKLAILLKQSGVDIDVYVWDFIDGPMLQELCANQINVFMGVPNDLNNYDAVISVSPMLYVNVLDRYKGKLFLIVGNRTQDYFSSKMTMEFDIAGCICDSQDTINFVEHQYADMPTAKWCHLNHPSTFQHRSPRNKTFIFGTMCGFRKQKRVDRIIEAFARISDLNVKLLIAGDGPMRADWEKLARNIIPEGKYEFVGHVNPGEFLPKINCFLHSTMFGQGGICMSMADAVAAGCYILTNNIAGVSENLSRGFSTMLPDDKFDELCPQEMIKIASMTQDDLDRVDRKAREYYSARYNSQTDIVKWIKEYL